MATTHAYAKEEMGRHPIFYLLNFGYYHCEDNIYPHLTSFRLTVLFSGHSMRQQEQNENFTYNSQATAKTEEKII